MSHSLRHSHQTTGFTSLLYTQTPCCIASQTFRFNPHWFYGYIVFLDDRPQQVHLNSFTFSKLIFQLLPSGRWYKIPQAWKKIYKNSFIPYTVTVLNKIKQPSDCRLQDFICFLLYCFYPMSLLWEYWMVSICLTKTKQLFLQSCYYKTSIFHIFLIVTEKDCWQRFLVLDFNIKIHLISCHWTKRFRGFMI